MKYCKFLRYHYSVIFLIFVHISMLSAINLEKMRLSKLYVKNNAKQSVRLTITFQQKCPECPVLHKTVQSKWTILPKEKRLIHHHGDSIKNIASKLSLSLDSPSRENIPTVVLEEKKKVKQTSKPKIPHLIHVLWFGNKNPLPPLFHTWVCEWQAKHPDWDVIVWDEERVKNKFLEKLFNQKIYDEACPMLDYATMSKIVRYEILHSYGGLFIEPNLKCFESFDPLHEQYDFYAGLSSRKSYGAVSNSVIGARAGHPILKACMEYIKKSDGPLPHDTCAIGSWMVRHLGNAPLTYAVHEKTGQKGNIDIVFPATYFDGNNVRRRFFHYEPSVHEQAYASIKHAPEAFCGKGAYSTTVNADDHEITPECLEPSFLDDISSLEFVSTGSSEQEKPKEKLQERLQEKLQEKPIVIITASYNNSRWLKRNVSSVFMQKYSNYRIIYIDDASPDGTGNLLEHLIQEYHLENKVTLIKNEKNQGAAANFYKASLLCRDDEIMVHLDGDDWLPHENVFSVVNKVYQDADVWMTFGQCIYHPRSKPGRSRAFPVEVIENNAFRKYPGWISHHLRTNYAWLFKAIQRKDLEYEGDFIKMNWDHALMYPMLEMAGHRAKFVPYMLYVHNGANPLNEGKGKGKKELQKYFAHYTRHQPPYAPLKEKPNMQSIQSK